jgi:hypothetical protein
MTIISLVLIAAGIVVIAYLGLSFATPGKPTNFQGIHIATTQSQFIPPTLGVLPLDGGIVLVLVKPKGV